MKIKGINFCNVLKIASIEGNGADVIQITRAVVVLAIVLILFSIATLNIFL